MKPSTRHILALAAALAVGAGCASSGKTQKQAATEQWNHTRAAVLCSLAQDQYAAGNLDKCRQTLDSALPMAPDNVNLILLAARVDVEQGRLESASAGLARAAALAPRNAEVDYLVGVVQQRWQRPAEARAAYARAVEKQPDDVAYVLAEAEMLVLLDDAPAARALLLDRVTYFEHSAAIRDAIGQLYESAGALPQAVDYYRQASVLDADDLDTRERLGLVLLRTGEYRGALAQLARVLRAPGAEARPDLAVAAAECEMQLGQPADARRRFEALAAADETDALAWLGIAQASLQLGDLRRAEQAAGRALALRPTASTPHAVMGYVRLRQGRFDDAAACYRRAIAIDGGEPTSHCMLGVALDKLGRRAEAQRCFGAALAIAPGDELARALSQGPTAVASMYEE